MKSLKVFSLASVLALGVAAGCTTYNVVGDDDGSGSGSNETKQLDASGRYSVQTKIDLQATPGAVGTVTKAFTDATDGPADPSEWVIDQILWYMPDGLLKSTLNGAKTLVAGAINDQVTTLAPTFVATMKKLGQGFGQMAKNFGLVESFDVSGSGGMYTATVNVLGVHFKVDATEKDVMFADHQMQPVTTSNVSFVLDNSGGIKVGEHKVPLSYGKILRIGLDEVLIPTVVPGTTNLAGLLAYEVDCNAVGMVINAKVGGSASGWASLCVSGLNGAAASIYAQLDAMDASTLDFARTGTARGSDSNNDHRLDKLQGGTWSGTLTYAGTPAPLTAATFEGTRL